MTNNLSTIEQSNNVVQADSLLEVISRVASDPKADVEKLERMMAMYERINDRTAQQDFNNAMMLAQSKMMPISADMNNRQTKSRYASYAALDKALRPIYTAHGFSISFDSGEGAPDGYVRVLAYVAHNDGFTRTYHIDMPSDGKGAKGGDVMTKTHAVGSGASYGMRYLLKMIFNVAIGEDDNDGNGFGGSQGVINETQIADIEGKIKIIGMSQGEIDGFKTYMGVSDIKDIKVNDYPKAVQALEKKKASKK